MSAYSFFLRTSNKGDGMINVFVDVCFEISEKGKVFELFLEEKEC